MTAYAPNSRVLTSLATLTGLPKTSLEAITRRNGRSRDVVLQVRHPVYHSVTLDQVALVVNFARKLAWPSGDVCVWIGWDRVQ